MHNLIPYNLFEMAKYNIDDYIKKVSEVIEVILDYDFKDLIEEIYGENLYEYFKVKSKPELNSSLNHNKTILNSLIEIKHDEDSHFHVILDTMNVTHFKSVGRNDSVYYLVVDCHSFEKLYLLEEFSLYNLSRVIDINPVSNIKRIFDNFYDVLKKDMIRHV